MKTPKNTELFNYYEKLGFTKEQCQILSLFKFNDRDLIRAINLYRESSLKLKWISFVQSLSDFIDFYWFTEEDELLWMYLFKLSHGSKYDNITREKLIDEYDKEILEPRRKEEDQRRKQEEQRRREREKRIREVKKSGELDDIENKENLCCKKCESEISFSDASYSRMVRSSGISDNTFRSKIPKASKIVTDERDFLEKTRYDKYQQIEEKWFLNVLSHPTSTFRTNCNTVSLDNIRENIRKGYNIKTSMVRAEELLNYFNYDLEDAKKWNKFWITVKMWDKPNSDNKMVLVWIKWENVAPTRQNIVLLLDVSGSMSWNEEQMQLTLMTFIAKLNEWDKFSLITYSDDDTAIIDDITFNKSQIDSIIERILTIEITWCTYGSWALNSAYDLIKSNKIEDWINRVVIMTDWDFNFGDCSTDSIKKLILKKKETWAYLSVIGTWTYNTNDELMETLAKNGNWNYYIVNNLEDVEENVYNKYNKLMYTIATDVKAQIEFNPKYVKSYRLIWYENRTLNHEDFKDDSVIAEPYWCWNYSIALYEVEMNDDSKADLWLRYQKSEIIESKELCNVSIRYKELWETKSKEESKSILYEDAYVNDSDLDLAYALFVVAENLRESEYISKDDVKIAKLTLKQLKHDKKYTINDSKLQVADFLINN